LKEQEEIRSQLRIREIRRIERIFVYHRWLYAVAVILVAVLYRPLPLLPVTAIVLCLVIANLVSWHLSPRLETVTRQTMFSLGMLLIDAMVSWGLMILFIRQPTAVIYAIFTLIVIEGAVRFSFIGSLVCGAFFIIGLSVAWLVRVSRFGLEFDFPAYVFWVGLITLISIMVGMAIREGRKQRAYVETLTMERTRLLERRRISNELHDTVLKSLQGLALEAHTLSKAAERKLPVAIEEKAHYFEEVCNSMSQEIRGVVSDIRDEEIFSASNIGSLMRLLIERWQTDSGIDVDSHIQSELPTLSHKLTHDLRRIAGEALANVQRHSQATKVIFSLAYQHDNLKLTIKDNGRGFDIEHEDLYNYVKAGKLGLISMKERVETEGGLLTIDSNNQGTMIAVSLPLEKRVFAESGLP